MFEALAKNDFAAVHIPEAYGCPGDDRNGYTAPRADG